MYIEHLPKLQGDKLTAWESFLSAAGLKPDPHSDNTVIVWDEGEIVATASRKDALIKCVATSEKRQGEGLSATLITEIRRDAFAKGITHLFLYTKPENKEIFTALFFYPIAQTDKVLLMESKKNGIVDFLASLPRESSDGTVGAAVMNCNPFTSGHRHLIETAAGECERVYVFAVSDDKSEFSFKDRFEMIKRGTADLKNVTVLPTGPYLVSSASFPDYFLKERDALEQVQCRLDVEIFSKYYAPRFSITRRYVGTEPLSHATACYNEEMRDRLPKAGIELIEIPRLTANGLPISASRVRMLISEGRDAELSTVLPASTLDYLKTMNLKK